MKSKKDMVVDVVDIRQIKVFYVNKLENIV